MEVRGVVEVEAELLVPHGVEVLVDRPSAAALVAEVHLDESVRGAFAVLGNKIAGVHHLHNQLHYHNPQPLPPYRADNHPLFSN